jgi:hypothetical protein
MTKHIPSIALCLLGSLLFASCTTEQNPSETQTNSTVLFEDSMMSDWQKNWWLEGRKATLEHRKEGLFFSGGTVTKSMDREEYHAHHAVLWTKQVFEGDIRITFEMTRIDTSNYGNTLLYILAQGIGTPDYPQDISTTRGTRDIPAMDKYFTYMDLLSLSFRKNLRARRYPLRSADPDAEPVGDTVYPHVDYIGMVPGKTYLVDVKKQGPSLTLRLSDKQTGEEYANHTWDMTQVGKEGNKTAPVLNKGRIGLRHMSTKQFIYKDFKVEQL